MGHAASARLVGRTSQRQIFRSSEAAKKWHWRWRNATHEISKHDLSPAERELLRQICLTTTRDERSECSASQSVLAARSGICTKSVQRLSRELEAKGFMDSIFVKGKGRVYRPNLQKIAPALWHELGLHVQSTTDILSIVPSLEARENTSGTAAATTSFSATSSQEDNTNTAALGAAEQPESVCEFRTSAEVDSPFQTTKAQRPGVAKVENLAARRVLDQWFKVVHRELAKSGKTAAAFPQRVAAIEARLVDGFAVEDLFDVVDGALTVRWVRENPHALAPELLFGGKNFELYMARGAEQREARERARKRDELAAAQREVTRLPNVATPAAADELAAIDGVFAVLDAVGT